MAAPTSLTDLRREQNELNERTARRTEELMQDMSKLGLALMQENPGMGMELSVCTVLTCRVAALEAMNEVLLEQLEAHSPGLGFGWLQNLTRRVRRAWKSQWPKET